MQTKAPHPVRAAFRRLPRTESARARGGTGGSTLKALYDVLMFDQSPVQDSLRQQLEARLRTDVAVDAFCLDYFPTVYHRFSKGMERTEKLNLERRTKPELAMVGGGAGDPRPADGAGVVCGGFSVGSAVKPSQRRPPKRVNSRRAYHCRTCSRTSRSRSAHPALPDGSRANLRPPHRCVLGRLQTKQNR